MNKYKIKNWSLLVIAMLAFTFTGCSDDTETSLLEVENFSNASIEAIQQGAIGKSRCLELIFPVSIEFADETTAEVTSYANLHETVSAWFEESGLERNRENKPQLIFPVQVLGEDGAVVDVASKEELQDLKSECKPDGRRQRGHRGKGFHCFDLVFPASLVIDGETVSFDDAESLKAAVKAYRRAQGRDAEKPELVFPVTIEYEDGNQVEVTSADELKAAKQSCREE